MNTTLAAGAAGSSATLVYLYQMSWHHFSEDHNLNFYLSCSSCVWRWRPSSRNTDIVINIWGTPSQESGGVWAKENKAIQVCVFKVPLFEQYGFLWVCMKKILTLKLLDGL